MVHSAHWDKFLMKEFCDLILFCEFTSGCSGTIFSGIGSGQVVDFGLRVGSGSWKILSSGIG